MQKAGTGQLSPGSGKESILTEGGGGRIGPPWPIGRANAGSEDAFEDLAGWKSIGLTGLLGRVKARDIVDEALGAQEAMEDSWPEGQDHPDDFGLEDLVQFFGAEGMGLG